MICPNCYAHCRDHDRFCSFCGAALPQAPEKPVVPAKGTRRVPALLLLIVSLAGLILFFVAPNPTLPTGTVSSPDCSWFTLENGVLYFDEALYTGGSELVVPDNICGVPVTSLSERCFYNCKTLQAVVLPDSLASIGEYAFFGCTSLRGIFIPSSVQTIGTRAFCDCGSLEAVYLHNSLDSIQSDAFTGCFSLRHIIFRGTFDEWQALYTQLIHPRTYVYCEDGTFPLR